MANSNTDDGIHEWKDCNKYFGRKLHNQTLPAITVCPVGLDFKLISKINPELERLYKEYLALTRKVNESLQALQDKYYQAYNIFFDWIKDKPIGDTLFNYTTHIDKKMINVKFYYAITSGLTTNNLVKIDASSKLGFEMISTPMETMAIYKRFYQANYIIYKCFTLFSHCESGWSDITMDFNKLNIQLSFDIESHSFFPYDTYPMAVHSPNNILDINNDLKFLKLGSTYKLGYSQWKIERLGNGYDTNCRDYNPKTL